MDRPKSARVRFFRLLFRASLGAVALGIGLVVWASVSIAAESVPSADAYSDLPGSSAASIAGHLWVAGDRAAYPFLADTNEDVLPGLATALAVVGPTADQARPPGGAAGDPTSTASAVTQVASTQGPVVPPPKEGDTIGILTIPVLNEGWPIIEGTGDGDLKRGVGHFIQSVLPGKDDNCVLSGHRTTVFKKMGKLTIGDRLIVQTVAGTFTYQIARIRIVHQNDRTVIVPTDHAVLTLTTCYPFVYIGSAPDRYIVSADLVARE